MFATTRETSAVNTFAQPVASKSRPFFQAKPSINTPGDENEQEADLVADKVMRMKAGDAPVVQSLPFTPVSGLQRKCTECEKEEKEKLQRKETTGSDAAGKSAPPIVSDVLSSGGHPLESGTRQFMERRFGQDFGQVRIHTDSRAAESAAAIQARAYTSGQDVVFGAGQHQPDSDSGLRLLAHELAHVEQQKTESGQASNSVRRTTNQLENDPADANIDCPIAQSSPDLSAAEIISFNINESTISTAGLAAIRQFAGTWHSSGERHRVRIDGFASIDGPPALNWDLSCRRSESILNELKNPTDQSQGVPDSFVDHYAHGETDIFSATSLAANRVGTLSLGDGTAPDPEPEEPAEPDEPNPRNCTGDFSDGHDETRDADHDLDKAHHTGERSPDVFLYDHVGGETGALIDFNVGFFGGTILESTSDDNTLYEHFVGGNGSRVNFPVSSDMAAIIGRSPTFTTFAQNFEQDLARYANEHGNLCGYDGNSFLSGNRPGYFHDPLFAWAVMGGYAKLEAHVTQTSDRISVTYKIYDHFGAGVSDAWSYLLGLSAMYYLQHFHGPWGTKYTPFIWSVEISRSRPIRTA